MNRTIHPIPLATPDHPGSTRLWRTITALLATIVALGALPSALAQLGARPAEQWLKTLDSANRLAGLKVDEVVAGLALKPGDVVADIGAGSGAFTFPLAAAVTSTGLVYAVDIEPGLIAHIAKKAREQQRTNIEAVLGKFTDPNLPARLVDVAFICDVLHHIEHRAEYLKNLARYLKPAGRVAVIDFYPELGPHRNEKALQITKDETEAWMAAVGFKPVAEHKLYDNKWYVIYGRQVPD